MPKELVATLFVIQQRLRTPAGRPHGSWQRYDLQASRQTDESAARKQLKSLRRIAAAYQSSGQAYGDIRLVRIEEWQEVIDG